MTARPQSKRDTSGVRLRRSPFADSRGRFGGLLVLAVLLIFGAVYTIWWRGQGSPDQSSEQVLDSNLALAQLASRLIDQQFANAESALRVITGRQVSASRPRTHPRQTAAPRPADRAPEADNRTFPQSVRDLLKLTGATSVEIYNAEGARLTSYPPPLANQNDARGIIQNIASSGSVSIQLGKAGGVFTLSVLYPEEGEVQGAGIATYRAQVLADWLGSLGKASQRSIYVIDAAARIVFTSRDGLPSGSSLGNYKPVQAALHGSGTMEGPAPGSAEPALLGYASASLPRWTVLIAKPAGRKEAPVAGLSNVQLLLFILAAVFILSSGWLFGRRKLPTVERAPRRFGDPDRNFPHPPEYRPQRPVAPPPASQRPPYQPATPQPVASRPVTPQPVASRPVISQPVISQPVTYQPQASQPAANQPMDSPPPSGKISVQQGIWKCACVGSRNRPPENRSALPGCGLL